LVTGDNLIGNLVLKNGIYQILNHGSHRVDEKKQKQKTKEGETDGNGKKGEEILQERTEA